MRTGEWTGRRISKRIHIGKSTSQTYDILGTLPGFQGRSSPFLQGIDFPSLFGQGEQYPAFLF
jgi:hypothetical protein